MTRKKIPVAILGATGYVGQWLVGLLSTHPWFEIVNLFASPQNQGKTYREAVEWEIPLTFPSAIENMRVFSLDQTTDASIIFSALDASIAGPIEESLAKKGHIIISNSSCYRMHPSVPLLLADINPEHLELIQHQPFGKGKIITNPNCSSAGLSVALKPLADRFGLEQVHVVTLQATSGAGKKGSKNPDFIQNVIPHISGEEEKIESEPLKILGTLTQNHIIPYYCGISAQSNRVPVQNGHVKCVSVKLRNRTSPEELLDTWNRYQGKTLACKLPSSPKKLIHYVEEFSGPQPKYHVETEKGMGVVIGRLRSCSLFDYKFVVLSHNMVLGAAGAAILNAEYYAGVAKLHLGPKLALSASDSDFSQIAYG